MPPVCGEWIGVFARKFPVKATATRIGNAFIVTRPVYERKLKTVKDTRKLARAGHTGGNRAFPFNLPTRTLAWAVGNLGRAG